MAVPLAQVADVAAVWREIDASEVARVSYLIDIASAKLRARLPTVDARMALFTTTPADVTALNPILVANVVATIVKRVMVNPDGLASSTQTFGPISESKTFQNGSEAAGQIIITAADLSELSPNAAQPGGAASRPRSTFIGLSPAMIPEPAVRPIW